MTEQRRPLSLRQAQALTLDTEPWLSCDGCFARTDTYVDLLLTGVHSADVHMDVHLIGCPACREEAESLITLRALELGILPDIALRMFAEQLAQQTWSP